MHRETAGNRILVFVIVECWEGSEILKHSQTQHLIVYFLKNQFLFVCLFFVNAKKYTIYYLLVPFLNKMSPVMVLFIPNSILISSC